MARLLTFTLALLSAGLLSAGENLPGKPAVSLTLVPPSPITDQITLDIRASVRNDSSAATRFEMALFLDSEEPGACLHRQSLDVPARSAAGIKFRWPARGHAGKHRLLVTAKADGQALRMERPLEIIQSEARSTRRLGGAWVDIYHHDAAEGKPFDPELGKMTDGQWRELVRAMHETGQDILVITMMLQNFTHRGRHKIESQGYQGKAYYPSKLFPGRMPIASPDPLEAILSEADKLGMHVLPGIGCYAFFDYTPGALRWCQRVASELWERYGQHPSFYGWYVSAEKDGSLGTEEERREMVDFFRQFTPYVRRLAPDKPVMLAPNCFHLRGAEAAYQMLLSHLDIICPFGFHRMPTGDMPGEDAATLMQRLCDEAGCHLWMDLESFVFRNGIELHPRAIRGLVSDFTRFPNFEKILHYQFPGMMSAPWMSRKPGGEASVKLYRDYQQFLQKGPDSFLLAHAARGCPVTLGLPPAPQYAGSRGPASLTDGDSGETDYLSRAWLGFHGEDVTALVDLQKSIPIRELRAQFLQYRAAGIFLPVRIEYRAGETPDSLRLVKTVTAKVAPTEAGPIVTDYVARDLDQQARFVQVRAVNRGKIPGGHSAAGAKAWLFMDEIVVNPESK